MSTLWAYGCSWTYCEFHSTSLNLKFWPEIIGEHIAVNVINRGEGGQSISGSLIKLIQDLSKIKKNDIVIFQFSYPDRIKFQYTDLNQKHYWIGTDIIHKKHEHFFKEKRMLTYLDFIGDFSVELLVKEFDVVSSIFDYIENIIGARVKYWFLYVIRGKKEKKILDYIDTRLWNHKRTVSFEDKEIIINPLYHQMDAERLITDKKLRFCDDPNGYDKRMTKILKDDIHPNQKGQILIAKHILKSIDKSINTDDINIPIKPRNLF